jgi:cell division protein FtsQ
MGRSRVLNKSAKSSGRARSAGNGATRKIVVEKSKPRSFAWVNRLFVLISVGVVIGALVKAAIVLDAIPVERIVVSGKLEHTQKMALQEMVQPALVGGFLSADLEHIRLQLESLPWVYEASVRRQWPNALEVYVVEQLPIARWGKSAFLNHEGEVFHPSRDSAWGSLPMLWGIDGSEQKLIADYQQISEILRPMDLSVSELAADGLGQLKVTLAGGIELLLGDEELTERLERFTALYSETLFEQKVNIRRVDMRYQSGIAVAFETLPNVAGI